jgi:hypothetical protein
MKILSNFNTKLDDELYAKACKQFGNDKVLIIRRDPIYLWFKVILPSIWRIIGVSMLIWLELRLLDAWVIDRIMMWIASGLIAIVWIVWIIHVCSKLMDYYMDFTIVTPKHIVRYDQCGLFTRGSVSLDLTNLRSVNEEKWGILKSIFNYGTIVFFSEGDYGGVNSNNGTITLKYINYPRKVREIIMNIIKD